MNQSKQDNDKINHKKSPNMYNALLLALPRNKFKLSVLLAVVGVISIFTAGIGLLPAVVGLALAGVAMLASGSFLYADYREMKHSKQVLKQINANKVKVEDFLSVLNEKAKGISSKKNIGLILKSVLSSKLVPLDNHDKQGFIIGSLNEIQSAPVITAFKKFCKKPEDYVSIRKAGYLTEHKNPLFDSKSIDSSQKKTLTKHNNM